MQSVLQLISPVCMMDCNLSIACADAHLSMGVFVCRAELISVFLCPCDTRHFSVRNVRVETKKKAWSCLGMYWIPLLHFVKGQACIVRDASLWFVHHLSVLNVKEQFLSLFIHYHCVLIWLSIKGDAKQNVHAALFHKIKIDVFISIPQHKSLICNIQSHHQFSSKLFLLISPSFNPLNAANAWGYYEH